MLQLIVLAVVHLLVHGNPWGLPLGHGCFMQDSRLTAQWLVCRP